MKQNQKVFSVMGFERNRYDGGIAVYDTRLPWGDGIVAEFGESKFERDRAEKLAAQLNAGLK